MKSVVLRRKNGKNEELREEKLPNGYTIRWIQDKNHTCYAGMHNCGLYDEKGNEVLEPVFDKIFYHRGFLKLRYLKKNNKIPKLSYYKDGIATIEGEVIMPLKANIRIDSIEKNGYVTYHKKSLKKNQMLAKIVKDKSKVSGYRLQQYSFGLTKPKSIDFLADNIIRVEKEHDLVGINPVDMVNQASVVSITAYTAYSLTDTSAKRLFNRDFRALYSRDGHIYAVGLLGKTEEYEVDEKTGALTRIRADKTAQSEKDAEIQHTKTL